MLCFLFDRVKFLTSRDRTIVLFDSSASTGSPAPSCSPDPPIPTASTDSSTPVGSSTLDKMFSERNLPRAFPSFLPQKVDAATYTKRVYWLIFEVFLGFVWFFYLTQNPSSFSASLSRQLFFSNSVYELQRKSFLLGIHRWSPNLAKKLASLMTPIEVRTIKTLTF